MSTCCFRCTKPDYSNILFGFKCLREEIWILLKYPFVPLIIALALDQIEYIADSREWIVNKLMIIVCFYVTYREDDRTFRKSRSVWWLLFKFSTLLSMVHFLLPKVQEVLKSAAETEEEHEAYSFFSARKRRKLNYEYPEDFLHEYFSHKQLRIMFLVFDAFVTTSNVLLQYRMACLAIAFVAFSSINFLEKKEVAFRKLEYYENTNINIQNVIQ